MRLALQEESRETPAFRKKRATGLRLAYLVFGIMIQGSWPSLSIRTAAVRSNRLLFEVSVPLPDEPYGLLALEPSLVETPSASLPLMEQVSPSEAD